MLDFRYRFCQQCRRGCLLVDAQIVILERTSDSSAEYWKCTFSNLISRSNWISPRLARIHSEQGKFREERTSSKTLKLPVYRRPGSIEFLYKRNSRWAPSARAASTRRAPTRPPDCKDSV